MKDMLIATLLVFLPSLPLAADEFTRYLVPVATDGVRGASGGEWSSYVTIFNYGESTILLNDDVTPFGICTPSPTPTELPSGTGIQTCQLGLQMPNPPTLFMRVRDGKRIALESRVVTPDATQPHIPVPVIPTSEFRQELLFLSVPLVEDRRAALRLYHAEPSGIAVKISFLQSSQLRAEHVVFLPPSVQDVKPGYAFVTISENMVPLSIPANVTVTVSADRPVWGMITSTQNVSQDVLLYTPATTP